MIRLARPAVWIVLIALFSPAPISAQTTTGTILGEVKDATGGSLPGVTVTALNQSNGATRETTTDALGTYRFTAMPPGTYTIKASLSGFQSATQADIRLPIASQVTVPLTLTVAGVAESVTVTQSAPLVDLTEQVVRTNIETKQIESLPLKTRDFLDLTMLAPGVVSDQGSASAGQTDSISFGGMSENYKSVWLEGVDFNDEVTGGGSSLSSATRIALASETIQEFQVMANSYSAEFGRSASGAINIVTKSGGNNVHGSAFYFRRDDAFEKPNYFAERVPPFKIEQYGATAGGPIRQNKLFYFGSWERRANNRSVQVNIPVSIRDFVNALGYDTRTDVPVTTDEHNVFAKGTYLVSGNHNVNASYMYDHRDLFNQQTGGESAGDHGYDDQRRAWFLVTNLTSVLRTSLVNELRVSLSHQGLDRVLPAGTVSRPEIRFPTVQFGRASNVPQGRSQDNYIVTNATTMHFVAKGAHDLKFGFEANIVPTTSTINQSFNGLFEFLQDRPVVAGDPTSLPFRFTQGIELRGTLAAMNRDVNIYSAFVNNQWQPRSDLTISLGLRYDFQFWRADLNGADIPDDVPIEQFWIRHTTGDLKGQNFKPVPNDLDNFGPRLGVTWDPFGNGRTVVRGGYGIYYDQINTTTLRSVVAGYPGFITTQIANDSRSGARIPNDFFPNLPTITFAESVGTSFRIASPDAESPFTHQFTAGTTRQLGNEYALSFDYVYMRGEHFPVTLNVNARRADGTFPLLASGLRLLLYEDASPIRIHQGQIRLQKRFANRLGFLLGYTVGSAKSIADNGTPSDKYNLMADWGPTANDVRHRVVSNVIYELPYGVQIGGIVTANSAPPYNITTGTDVNRDGDNNDRPSGVDYNTGRGDRFFQTDMRLSKKFSFGKARAEVLWEMFNLFNTVNFNNFQGNQSAAPGTTATGIPTGFGRPRQAFDAFQGQLGLKLMF
ncbi:MAG TPA: carboxypeptidase regulatory-like domain-containing protein [Vicinamibacterales bacterium]|nr:carboxypeptidase regulatory-like domain-containing protein [Vicinamibacterales bacterium]